MFRYGDHIMGIQGHPEYTNDILLHLIDRLLQRNFIEVDQSFYRNFDYVWCIDPQWLVLTDVLFFGFGQESYAAEVKGRVGAVEADNEAWKKLCTSFLKGRMS